MKKILLALAVSTAALAGPAQAALVTIPFTFQVDFADPTVAADLALLTGGTFSGSATYDDAIAPDGLGVYTASTLNLAFGNRNFTEVDDISGFGVGIGTPGPTNNFTGLLFETVLTLTGAAGAGNYLLSFTGASAQLTPSGDTFDYKVTASAVPLPAALPLLAAGLGLVGWVGRRRRVQAGA